MNKPRCPYCGAEMVMFQNDRGYVTHSCECGARAPEAFDRESAHAAAMQRYQEPNRVLTLEEAVNKLDKKDPLYIEINGEFGGVWVGNGEQIYAELRDGWSGSDKEDWSGAQWDKAYGQAWRLWLRRPTDKEREEEGRK